MITFNILSPLAWHVTQKGILICAPFVICIVSACVLSSSRVFVIRLWIVLNPPPICRRLSWFNITNVHSIGCFWQMSRSPSIRFHIILSLPLNPHWWPLWERRYLRTGSDTLISSWMCLDWGIGWYFTQRSTHVCRLSVLLTATRWFLAFCANRFEGYINLPACQGECK